MKMKNKIKNENKSLSRKEKKEEGIEGKNQANAQKPIKFDPSMLRKT
jgi:hypothetical protein